MPSDSASPAPATPRLFVALMALSIAAALVPTVWTGVDLALAGLFTGTSPTIASADWWWVVGINLYVPALFRIGLALCFVAWLVVTFGQRWKNWRLPLAFVVVAGIMGPGVVVNAVFKDNWQRARPYQVENFGGVQEFTRAAVMTDQCNNNCSFVSGHVACGFFLTTLMLVNRRRRIQWALVGTSAGLVIGFSRMTNVAHWFSDVLWAYPITLATSWLVWRGLVHLYQWRDARTSSP
ncbi:MAG: phosphatase PAP2 family protein [Curvibacter sp.]|nr:MAG: phosphatase PAP2 family protein [Curvibacter sp.]